MLRIETSKKHFDYNLFLYKNDVSDKFSKSHYVLMSDEWKQMLTFL